MHAYVHTYIHTHIHTYTHTPAYIHSYTHTHIHIHIHTHIHTRTHARAHTHTHTHTHTRAHTHTHTHAHTRTHTHTHARARISPAPDCRCTGLAGCTFNRMQSNTHQEAQERRDVQPTMYVLRACVRGKTCPTMCLSECMHVCLLQSNWLTMFSLSFRLLCRWRPHCPGDRLAAKAHGL